VDSVESGGVREIWKDIEKGVCVYVRERESESERESVCLYV
jgi:hypothetical protein